MQSSKPEGQLALVTGASSGIGEAYAKKLALEGWDLIISARRKDKLRFLAAELKANYGTKTKIITADLSTNAGVELIKKRIEKGSPIDLLVNCAGFGTRGHFADIDPEKIERMVYLHSMAPALLTRAILPGMIERNRGTVVAISSLGAFLTTSEYTTYSATKAFLNTFYKGLHDELAGKEIEVQAICPGLVRTGFMETDEYKDFDYSNIPEFAWMSPERVVDISLKALKKERGPIVIAGLSNKIFIGLMHTAITGPVIRKSLGYFSRKRVIEGKPALF